MGTLCRAGDARKGGGYSNSRRGDGNIRHSGFDGSTLKVTALLLDETPGGALLWFGTLNQGIYRIQGKG